METGHRSTRAVNSGIGNRALVVLRRVAGGQRSRQDGQGVREDHHAENDSDNHSDESSTVVAANLSVASRRHRYHGEVHRHDVPIARRQVLNLTADTLTFYHEPAVRLTSVCTHTPRCSTGLLRRPTGACRSRSVQRIGQIATGAFFTDTKVHNINIVFIIRVFEFCDCSSRLQAVSIDQSKNQLINQLINQ